MTDNSHSLHALVRHRLVRALLVVALLLLILIEGLSALRGVYEFQQSKANAEKAQNEAAGTEWMKKKALDTSGIVGSTAPSNENSLRRLGEIEAQKRVIDKELKHLAGPSAPPLTETEKAKLRAMGFEVRD